MHKKYNNWYSHLTPIEQFGVSFALNWFYWLIARFILDWIFGDNYHTLPYYVFHAMWMSFFTTIVLHWNVVKAIFRKGNAPNIVNDQSGLRGE